MDNEIKKVSPPLETDDIKDDTTAIDLEILELLGEDPKEVNTDKGIAKDLVAGVETDIHMKLPKE